MKYTIRISLTSVVALAITALSLAATPAFAKWPEKVLLSFDGTNGSLPRAGLTLGSDGAFYGMTGNGGGSNAGTIFKITSTGVFTLLYSFSGGSDGAYPSSNLVQGKNGDFYGTTFEGGTEKVGTVFKLTPAGVLTTLHSFAGPSDGSFPAAGLALDKEGNLVGTTENGGSANAGTVFKITPDGVLTTLYSFTGGIDGGVPLAPLTLGSDGNFYGSTFTGGAQNSGTLFRISTAGQLATLYSFTGGNDGAGPEYALIQASDGNFYGANTGGGTSNNGSIFKITADGSYTLLHSFTGVDGKAPAAGLIQARDGDLFGTTQLGGALNRGTIFRLSTGGALTTIYSFTVIGEGVHPAATLVQGPDRYLYGSTFAGGANNVGTIYRVYARP